MQQSIILLIDLLVRDNFSLRPFTTADRNKSYQHLAQQAQAKGITLWVSHFNNIDAQGELFYWTVEEEGWVLRVGNIQDVQLAYAELPPHIPRSVETRTLFATKGIPVHNDLRLLDLATDKLLTYQYFPENIPYTIAVDNDTLAEGVAHMRGLTHFHPDLDNRILFLKPRFGLWGDGIYILEPDTPLPQIEGEYILQLFLESDGGIPEVGISGRHDMRLMLYNDDIFQFKVKVPIANPYISNRQQRGKLYYYEMHELPERITSFGLNINAQLSQFSPKLYSIDVGIGRSGTIWIYELNTMPGLAWNSQNPPSIAKTKESHTAVLDMLQRLVHEPVAMV